MAKSNRAETETGKQAAAVKRNLDADDENGGDDAPSSSARTLGSEFIHNTHVCWPTAPLKSFTYFRERYFDQYFVRDAKGIPGNHLRLLRHSNGLVVVCLDPTHALVVQCKAAGTTPLVTFDMKRRGSGDEMKDRRADVQNISGKRKKQAPFVQPDTVLVALGHPPPTDATRGDEGPATDAVAPLRHEKHDAYNRTFTFKVPASIQGNLLELNSRIEADPTLLVRGPLSNGYVAVLVPKLAERQSSLAAFEMVSKSLATLEPRPAFLGDD